jgi:hypothetical protein
MVTHGTSFAIILSVTPSSLVTKQDKQTLLSCVNKHTMPGTSEALKLHEQLCAVIHQVLGSINDSPCGSHLPGVVFPTTERSLLPSQTEHGPGISSTLTKKGKQEGT